MPLLGHHLMAYAAEYIVIENALIFGELSELDVIFRGLQAVCRDLMVEEKNDPGGVPDPGIPACNLIESLHCQGAGDIVNHGTIYVRHDELARLYLFFCRSG